jgi:hypothetical protein
VAYKNPNYMREYRESHREGINARQRAYNKKHRLKIRLAARERCKARTPEQKAADKVASRERYLRFYKKRMVSSAKLRSKQRGWPAPTITPDDIQIPEFCPVLGLKLEVGVKTIKDNSPSLDVFNRSRFYVPGNVRVISQKANTIKNNATVEDVRRVLAYMEGSQNGWESQETASSCHQHRVPRLVP